MFIQDAHDVQHLNLFQKAFYSITTFGPDSVIIFFVLSGFLVGGSVVKKLSEGRWSLGEYTIARASRLYTVLIPALLIGVLLDLSGTHFLGWTTPYSQPNYGTMLPRNIADYVTPAIFAGNALFLQTIVVPPLGSNHPLWSLANEAWYYVLFALFALLIINRRRAIPTAALVISIMTIVAFLPTEITLPGLTWLMGVAVACLPAKRVPFLLACSTAILLVVFLVANSAKLIVTSLDQYIIGALFSAVMYCWLSRLDKPARKWIRISTGYLSKISFTLYLVHVPLMLFMAALIIRDGERFQPSLVACSLVVGAVGLCVIYAWCLWMMFERKTPAVRDFLTRNSGRSGLSSSHP
jgi:peptidoglycan/LPS O-acetylase OafA/YrhL